jgi:kynurenine formamidase/glyoxylase-like metal-dependent hydrolase (beta-lactamase superfamily II)
MKIIVTIVLIVFSSCCYGQKVKQNPFDVSVYHGDEIHENAFLIRGNKSLVLIDALGSENAAQKIAQDIAGKKLNTIFITHAHPDHFLGLATVLKEHPETMVYVANEEIKQDILRYVEFASDNGSMDRTPTMKPISRYPGGFDYQRITNINKPRLDVGNGKYLTIEAIAGSAECGRNTILYNEESNLLFASDLLYNNVFNWMGPGVNQHSIENWIASIEKLKARFKTNVVIFPGHGQQSDHSLFDTNINYLRSFRSILCRTTSQSDAKIFFKQLYPAYRGDFLLTRSIQQWADSCTDKFISIRHMQDLTHTLTPDFPFIPVPGITFPFEIKPIATIEQNGVSANRWVIHEHLGTQIDAPNHFVATGLPLEKLEIKELIVPIVVIDISAKCAQDPDATLTVEDIKQWETTHGGIPVNACVMMYSGWEHFLHTDKYLGLQGHTKHFPGISLDAINFLISERDIAGVGVDVISFDPGNDNNYKGHKLLLGKNKWALEAVANLKLIPEKGAWLFVGAPKIEGATGGIVRLLAVW